MQKSNLRAETWSIWQRNLASLEVLWTLLICDSYYKSTVPRWVIYSITPCSDQLEQDKICLKVQLSLGHILCLMVGRTEQSAALQFVIEVSIPLTAPFNDGQ